MTLFSLPIHRFTASGSFWRAIRAKERVEGTEEKREMYSPSLRFEFWVWAYHTSEVDFEVDFMT